MGGTGNATPASARMGVVGILIYWLTRKMSASITGAGKTLIAGKAGK